MVRRKSGKFEANPEANRWTEDSFILKKQQKNKKTTSLRLTLPIIKAKMNQKNNEISHNVFGVCKIQFIIMQMYA